jgi:hypothetical protein
MCLGGGFGNRCSFLLILEKCGFGRKTLVSIIGSIVIMKYSILCKILNDVCISIEHIPQSGLFNVFRIHLKYCLLNLEYARTLPPL